MHEAEGGLHLSVRCRGVELRADGGAADGGQRGPQVQDVLLAGTTRHADRGHSVEEREGRLHQGGPEAGHAGSEAEHGAGALSRQYDCHLRVCHDGAQVPNRDEVYAVVLCAPLVHGIHLRLPVHRDRCKRVTLSELQFMIDLAKVCPSTASLTAQHSAPS